MQVRPIEWEFTGADFCCNAFKMHASTHLSADGYVTPDFKLSKNGDLVLYNGVAINYCPFCGKEIELKEEVS